MRILIFIIIFLPILSFSQKENVLLECDFPIEKINDSTFKIKVSDFDSLHAGETCFLSWMNSGLNKPDGELIVFDENGVKRRKAVYKNRIRVGTHLFWYSTGELESETTWETDLYFSSKSYYKSGKIKFTAEDGNRDSAVYKWFYENGKLKSIENWSGEKNWYENGNLKSERNTKSNEYKEWFENGQIKVQGKLKNGWTRIGKWKYYNENGEMIRILNYKVGNTSWYLNENGYKSEKKY